MRVTLDPMPALRVRAVSAVNSWFDGQVQLHRESAWARKREIAKVGAPYPEWFAREAELRKITSQAFADVVLSKPDVVADRELRRQTLLAAVDTAKTPADIATILDNLK